MLAHFVADTARLPLPPEVARKAAFCLLDALGLGILARQEKTVLAINSLTGPESTSSGQDAGLALRWTDGARVGVTDAVIANAVAVHAQFHDDTDYSSWTHPGWFCRVKR